MKKTVRLLFPQWQGGNNPAYAFGAELLAWLAPQNSEEQLIRVPVSDEQKLPVEDGIVGKSILLEQLNNAKELLSAKNPDRVIVFGGDCLVEQAPIDYLSGKYGDELGVIWIDAHPDISNSKHTKHAHAMVLGNLLNVGDPDFSANVANPLAPSNVAYVGIEEPLDYEEEIYQELNVKDIRNTTTKEIVESLNNWMEKQKIKYLMVHLDLDVLDPAFFRATLFANPDTGKINASEGTMKLEEVVEIISEVSARANIVGLGITEHLPWDALNLKNALAKIDIFN